MMRYERSLRDVFACLICVEPGLIPSSVTTLLVDMSDLDLILSGLMKPVEVIRRNIYQCPQRHGTWSLNVISILIIDSSTCASHGPQARG